MVQVEVGLERTVFHIHKKLLSDASPYFRTALNDGFKEVRNTKHNFTCSTYMAIRSDTNIILPTE